jgi:hypothetical protein
MNSPLSLLELAASIGPGIRHLSFAVHLQDRILKASDFTLILQADGQGIVWVGEYDGLGVEWRFTPERGGWRVTLTAGGEQPFSITRIDSLILTYAPGAALNDWRIPTRSEGVEGVGMIRAAQLGETLEASHSQTNLGAQKYATGSLLRGAFPNSRQPGLLLATLLPQNYRHLYTVEQTATDALRFTASTHFLKNQPIKAVALRQYTSESTWLCGVLPIRAAITAYAEHLPRLNPPSAPATGWNSWDYYFSALTLDDITENLDALCADPDLAGRLQYAVVDMGWEHCWGEWQPNYRFPGGLERLVGEIRSRGFTPGIWTAPLIVHPLSYPGLRNGEILIQNEYGDPWSSPEGGQYAVDPTHPAGQAFLRQIFTRLHHAGFRLFKIDYVSAIVSAARFHDPSRGPYGALADFFRLVRECVGPESHILGCSLPAECGPGLCDSHRVGIDIHNQWTHIEWAMDFYQFAYWQNDRLAINDPDFLIVRGCDTSLEAETNVLNPMAHHPHPPRWRHGPVFNMDEARTWATIVSLTAGNRFLSDRIIRLNGAALALIRRVMASPISSPAVPLDLADGDRPSLWLSRSDGQARLGIINWTDITAATSFDFSDWQIHAPPAVQDFWTGSDLPVEDGELKITLAPHASVYVTWPYEC